MIKYEQCFGCFYKHHMSRTIECAKLHKDPKGTPVQDGVESEVRRGGIHIFVPAANLGHLGNLFLPVIYP